MPHENEDLFKLQTPDEDMDTVPHENEDLFTLQTPDEDMDTKQQGNGEAVNFNDAASSGGETFESSAA